MLGLLLSSTGLARIFSTALPAASTRDNDCRSELQRASAGSLGVRGYTDSCDGCSARGGSPTHRGWVLFVPYSLS
jgi:hypothetical protein